MFFRDKYAFLSNFAWSKVTLDGYSYASVEHAFQAAKTLNPLQRETVRLAPYPAMAKKLGRQVTLRPDWDMLKLMVMEQLLRQKFSHPSMVAQLLATGDEQLVEENTWGDTYWGVCKGYGKNHLGKLLMKIRAELKK